MMRASVLRSNFQAMPTIADIAALLGATPEFTGPPAPDTGLAGPGIPGKCSPEDVVFIGKTAKSAAGLIAKTTAGLLILDRSLANHWTSPAGITAVLWSDNARLDFCRVLNRFFVPRPPEGVHSSAVIAPSAKLGQRVSIGPGCAVSDGVEIGDDCVLHGRVVLYSGVRLGRRVVIHAGAVVGADGFGYEKRPDGTWEKFPHLGGVVIGDDVEIGANTCIDRGTLGDTLVRCGVKIDNLVHIAHNAEIGARSLVTAGTVVCGSARVGEDVWLAPLSCVRDRTAVGDGSTIGMGAILNEDVPPGTVMAGTPARPLKAAARIKRFLDGVAEGKNVPG